MVKKMIQKTYQSPRAKGLKIIAYLLVLLLWLGGTSVAGEPPPTVAKVNKTILSESDLQRALNEIMPAGSFHGGFSSKKRASRRPQAIEKMIEKELFYQEAVRMKMTVDKATLENKYKKIIMRMGGEKKYLTALNRAGISKKQHIHILEKQLLTESFIEREITLKSSATDHDAQTHFRSNRAKFQRPEARRMRHILIAVKPSSSKEERQGKEDLARQILTRIKSGEDMASLAAKHSNDKYRIKGGDYGLVHAGRLVPELEKEVFKLPLNSISDVIKTMYGFHIVRVEEIKRPEQLTYEEVSDKIKKMLTGTNETRLRQALLKRLRSAATVTIY